MDHYRTALRWCLAWETAVYAEVMAVTLETGDPFPCLLGAESGAPARAPPLI